MNSSVNIASVNIAFVNVHECEKCLKLETKLLKRKDFIEKDIYNKLFKSFTTLEKHCISLEVDTQLNQENFQMDNSVSNQRAPSFDQLFELNKLKAQSQKKDMVIKKLKERIKALSGKKNEDKIKQELEEIETINIELDHREKVLVITALKNDLRKLKGKYLTDNAVTQHTIDPEILKTNVESLNPRLLNNRTVQREKFGNQQKRCLQILDTSWRPTGRTFTIIGNACPLTRITTTAKVPLRKQTTLESDTSKHVVTLVYSRKPKKSKTNVPVSKPKNIKSLSANKKKPSKS
ncbi:hypothetical protein Tco_0246172 [Tanacetum coccineum]